MNLRQDIVESICDIARRNNVQRVILFGSRARGDNRERSDIDLAATGGNVAAFSLYVDEETPTLLMYDVVTEAGLVSLFQICLELSWKAMRQALEEQGYAEAQTGSPRKVIKCAYSAGMIDDEQGWIDAPNSRNLLAHTQRCSCSVHHRQDEERVYPNVPEVGD